MASAMSEPGGAGLGTLGFNPEIAERMSRGVYPVQNARLPRSRKSLLRSKTLSRINFGAQGAITGLALGRTGNKASIAQRGVI